RKRRGLPTGRRYPRNEPDIRADVRACLAAAPTGDVEPPARVQVHAGWPWDSQENFLFQIECRAVRSQFVAVDFAAAPVACVEHVAVLFRPAFVLQIERADA